MKGVMNVLAFLLIHIFRLDIVSELSTSLKKLHFAHDQLNVLLESWDSYEYGQKREAVRSVLFALSDVVSNWQAIIELHREHAGVMKRADKPKPKKEEDFEVLTPVVKDEE